MSNKNTLDFLGFKLYADSTFKKMTKDELIDYIKMLYHNWSATDERLVNVMNVADKLDNSLQEALTKAEAFDVLMNVLNNDTFIMDTENYSKTIQISQGYQKLEIPISDEDYEILERAMEVKDNE